YAATRNRLRDVVMQNQLNNLVVLTGDQHNNWVIDLKEDFNRPDSATWGTEFVGTSITSGGNGSELSEAGRLALAENPHVKFFNNRRGYVRCTVTEQEWRTDFRVLPSITRKVLPAPIVTRASFVVENGKPGAVETEATSSV